MTLGLQIVPAGLDAAAVPLSPVRGFSCMYVWDGIVAGCMHFFHASPPGTQHTGRCYSSGNNV